MIDSAFKQCGDLNPTMCPENNNLQRPNRNSADRLKANGPGNHMVAILAINSNTEAQLVRDRYFTRDNLKEILRDWLILLHEQSFAFTLV